MRIVLRRDNEELTIVRAFEARNVTGVRDFTSEHMALGFLSSFFSDGVSLLPLRFELEGSRETTDVMRMDDREVLRSFARLIASGLVKVITSIVPRATLSLGELPAKGAAEPRKAPPLEMKPAPIVPQEYPILARVESNEVINSTRRLVADLQKLMFELFNRNVPPSQVATEYMLTAEQTAADTRRELEELEMNVEKLLFRGASLKPPPSAIAVEYATLGPTEGKFAKGVVESFSAGLKSLMWEEKERSVPPSSIAAEYKNVALDEADRAKATIGEFALSLDPLHFKEKERSVPDPAIATEYKELGQVEGNQAKVAVQGFAAGLTTLLFSETELSNIRSGSGSDDSGSEAP